MRRELPRGDPVRAERRANRRRNPAAGGRRCRGRSARPAGIADYGFRYYDPVTGRWLSSDPFSPNWETGELNYLAFVSNDGVNWVDLLGLRKTKDEYDRERMERAEAKWREREEKERLEREAEERRKRIDRHYTDNEVTNDANRCAIEIVWGHTGDAEGRAADLQGRVAACGVLGCKADQPEGDLAIPGFPDVSGGWIGDREEATNGNGGFNPNQGRTQQDRKQGFANLLQAAFDAAFGEGRRICQETYDTPPCCKTVTIRFNGGGERGGIRGDQELRRRLTGTQNRLNAHPIYGVSDGKTWTIDCSKEVR